jgi:hypothetical protein
MKVRSCDKTGDKDQQNTKQGQAAIHQYRAQESKVLIATACVFLKGAALLHEREYVPESCSMLLSILLLRIN